MEYDGLVKNSVIKNIQDEYPLLSEKDALDIFDSKFVPIFEKHCKKYGFDTNFLDDVFHTKNRENILFGQEICVASMEMMKSEMDDQFLDWGYTNVNLMHTCKISRYIDKVKLKGELKACIIYKITDPQFVEMLEIVCGRHKLADTSEVLCESFKKCFKDYFNLFNIKIEIDEFGDMTIIYLEIIDDSKISKINSRKLDMMIFEVLVEYHSQMDRLYTYLRSSVNRSVVCGKENVPVNIDYEILDIRRKSVQNEDDAHRLTLCIGDVVFNMGAINTMDEEIVKKVILEIENEKGVKFEDLQTIKCPKMRNISDMLDMKIKLFKLAEEFFNKIEKY